VFVRGNGSTKKRKIGEIYDYNQREKGNPMGFMPNKGVRKGVGSTKKRL
jgi:hypothetical protein